MEKVFTIMLILIIGIIPHIYSQMLVDIEYQSCAACPQGANTNTPVSNALFGYLSPKDTFALGDVESDFDLRRAMGNSRWHKGVDLRNHGAGVDMQRGDALINPEQGTIVTLSGSGYKYITIDSDSLDFGYGHIFSHNNINNTTSWRSGNFVLKMDLGNQQGLNRLPCIINLDSCTAYSTIANRQVVLNNNPNSTCMDTLITTNIVNQGAAFAPIGGSRNNTSLDFAVHLHLYKFINPLGAISETNCLDPSYNINYQPSNFDLQISFNQNCSSPKN